MTSLAFETESVRSDKSSRSKRAMEGRSNGHQQQIQTRRPRGGGQSTGANSGDELLGGRDEVIPVEGEWGDTATCLTGNTSDAGHSCEDLRLTSTGIGGDVVEVGGGSCLPHPVTVVTMLLSLAAFLSPSVMVALPRVPLIGDWGAGQCGADCQGVLLSVAFKQLFLLVALWALFMRRQTADVPRVHICRAFLAALVFLVTFAFWLFYGVRVVQGKEVSYEAIVTFASSLLDALLFLHYLAVVLLEIRRLRPEYRLHVVRSPDGFSQQYTVGVMSIQEAAVMVLNNYYRDFPVFNPHLERIAATSSSGMRMRGMMNKSKSSRGGSVVKGGQIDDVLAQFKIYQVDGPSGNGSNINPQAIMAAAARKRDTGHNDRFYIEMELERKIKRRKARLVTAAEEAFAHVRRINEEKGPCIPMTPEEAAQAVFPSVARSLQKFLRVTRQQPRHSAEQVVRHLAQFLSFDMSPKAFLERFFNTAETNEASGGHVKWSIRCDSLTSRSLRNGVVFQLRCRQPNMESMGISLLVSVSQLPFFNLTEEVFDSKNNRFVLRMSSETSV